MNIALLVITFGILLPSQLAYIIYLIYRLFRLHKLSDCRAVLPFVLKARLLLILALILLNAIELIVSQVDSEYWLHPNAGLGYMLLLPMLQGLVQICVFYYEYRKRVPYNFFNGVLWFLYGTLNSIMLVILALQQNTYAENYIILGAKDIISVTLLIICIFKFQDYSEFFHLHIINTIKLSHILITKGAAEISVETALVRQQYQLTRMNGKVKLLEIEKELKMDLHEDHQQVTFKIVTNSVPPKVVQQSENAILGFLGMKMEEMMSLSYAERIISYQELLNLKIERDGCSNQVLNFLRLQISQLHAMLYPHEQQGTVQELEEDGEAGDGTLGVMAFKAVVSDHILVDSHIEYRINLSLGRLVWQVRKRFAQFDRLRLELKSYGLRTIHIYKGKDIDKRKKSLEAFCQNTLNQRIYWKNELWKFFAMDKQIPHIMRLFQLNDSLQQRKPEVSIIGQESAIDSHGKVYIRYLIQVGKLPCSIKHRYNEFVQMDKAVQARMPDVKLPSLPAKGIKEDRGRLLQVYLHELLEIEGVRDLQEIESFLGGSEQMQKEATISFSSVKEKDNWPLRNQQHRLSLLNIKINH